MKSFLSLLLVLMSVQLFSHKDNRIAAIYTNHKNSMTGEPETLIKQFFEAIQENDQSALSKYIANEVAVENVTSGSSKKFSEMSTVMKERVDALHKALGNVTIEIEDTLTEGNRIFVNL